MERLDVALPRDAEFLVGKIPVHVDDILNALRELARKLELKSNPVGM